MSSDNSELWLKLKTLNYVTGDSPDSLDIESPWYVRLMTGFAAWIAALFMLGFLGMLFESILDNGEAAISIGCIMMLTSYLIFKNKKNNDFINQFSLVFSFSGQILFIIGVIEIEDTFGSNTWFYIFILQACLALFMPNYVHRVSSSFFSAIALSMAMTHNNIVFLQSAILISISSYIWINEFKWFDKHSTLIPISYGLTLALIYQESTNVFFDDFNELFRNLHSIEETLLFPWAGELLIGLSLLFVVWQLLIRHNIRISNRISIASFIGAILLILISLKATGITVGITILILGYANGNRILMALGISALLFYMSSYYYLLDNTLYEKSQLLAILGIFLLTARWLMTYLSSTKTLKGSENEN
ncbi:MAG: hypothetical protein DIZ80_17375 [endosymbiont of Galathealinum brachiosum]|uniref:DUF4401 domain-containing protein n=1 Tax=endosymbiont of Galathealinum brachiosum TaxID=2200906 RepID=A0A370D8V5_9GAMM|nr:MAG: hypothetical protein DIZ80_17375 [endosymbiont of Galathealinum brachiosum]